MVQPSQLTFRSKRFHLAALRSSAHLREDDPVVGTWFVWVPDRLGVHSRTRALDTTLFSEADPIRAALWLELLSARQAFAFG